jgi:hypothetical protein
MIFINFSFTHMRIIITVYYILCMKLVAFSRLNQLVLYQRAKIQNVSMVTQCGTIE